MAPVMSPAFALASASIMRASMPLTTGTFEVRAHSVVRREKVRPSCDLTVSLPFEAME